MDDDNVIEFSRAVKLHYTEYLKYIEDSCRVLFKSAIATAVYKYYPKTVEYDRTYNLLNSVKSYMHHDTLFIYINTSSLNYHSAVWKNEDVSEIVPWFLTNDSKSEFGSNGHHDYYANTRGGQYHSYEKRNYLELAKTLIEAKFNIPVEIINDNPYDDEFFSNDF